MPASRLARYSTSSGGSGVGSVESSGGVVECSGIPNMAVVRPSSLSRLSESLRSLSFLRREAACGRVGSVSRIAWGILVSSS